MSPGYLVAFAAMALIGGGLALFLRRTDFGLGVLAASQDPVAVRLVGIRFSRVSAFTWGMAGFVGAVAALLIQPLIGAFGPGFMTGFFVRALAAALIGGLTSLPGRVRRRDRRRASSTRWSGARSSRARSRGSSRSP